VQLPSHADGSSQLFGLNEVAESGCFSMAPDVDVWRKSIYCSNARRADVRYRLKTHLWAFAQMSLTVMKSFRHAGDVRGKPAAGFHICYEAARP
jgi:hypothetical protein